MEIGQVFATLDIMDIEARVEAERANNIFVRGLEKLFDRAAKRITDAPQDRLERYINFLQMVGVVRRLYERFHERSALYFYREMKKIFTDREMEAVYRV